MSPNSAKRKGDNAEREAALLLAELTGWPVRRKLGAGRTDDEGDLDGVPDTTLQIKDWTNLTRACAEGLPDLRTQQQNAGTTFAALLVRRYGGRYVAVMELDQLATLLPRSHTAMSFARFGHDGSQVYVFETEDGFECCGCWLNEHSIVVPTARDMLVHLGEHRTAGHVVPDYAIAELEAEP